MASRNPQTIDVDAFRETKPTPRLTRRPVTPTPILISDDEDEIFEVVAKLESRNTETRSRSMDSDVELVGRRSPPPEFIDLVSDDEHDPEVVQSSSKGKSVARNAPAKAKRTRSVAAANRGQSSAATDAKPPAKASVSSHRKPAINHESAIKQDTPRMRKRKTQIPEPPAEPEDLEDEYEHTTTLIPFKQATPPPPRTPSPSGQPSAHRRSRREPTPPVHRNRFEPPPQPTVDFVEPQLSRKRRYVNISSGHLPSTSSADDGERYIWDVLREFRILPHAQPRPRFSKKRPRLVEALDMDHYVKTHQFRRAGGSINGILQHNGRVVVCSSSAGGDATGETDPYNKTGTLISWCKRDPSKILDLEKGDSEIPDATSHDADDEEPREDPLLRTHYSIRSIAYDPDRDILASSGADDYVRTWKYENDADVDPYSATQSWQYRIQAKIASPQDLAFKPGGSESILAVGERSVITYVGVADSNVTSYRSLTIENLSVEDGQTHTFNLVDKRNRDDHRTGAIAWGSGVSSSLVIALSEPVSDTNHVGYHHAFDVGATRTAFKFIAPEAGDALAVDPTGDRAALVTTGETNSFLRIYDIRTQNGTAMQVQTLETFDEKASREVNSMAFSPDGIYLALGRADNCTHVYDSRMLKGGGMLQRGVLYNFRHSAMDIPNHLFFGVVGVHWAANRSSRLGLVTGGNDGCVRLWDPLRANEPGGTILAQADSDVASFTLGDRFQGEHELVVGDSDGSVYVLDGHASL
ncbi:WD40-repeat-containing domain protein [Mycena vitilis]|nr:WD40-repeat-containing domain protein [Mycena vitilis]